MKTEVDLGVDVSQRWYNAPLLVDENTAQYLKRLAEAGSRLIKAHSPTPHLMPADLSPAMFLDTEARRPYAIENGIAKIHVRGYLEHDSYWYTTWWTGYDALRMRLETAIEDPMVKGIAWMINSNGGEVAGNFDLVDRIFAARNEKPMIAVVNESAYSAAYSIATASDRIFVNRTGGVGSIGVIMAHFDYSRMLEDQGVDVTLIYAGARKADGNRYEPLSAEAKNSYQKRVDDMYALFVDTVARNRDMNPDDVRGTEAALYGGEEAVESGLADEVRSAEEALAIFTRELEGSLTQGVIMTTENKPGAGAENGETISVADHQRALEAARSEGYADGVQAENARIFAILNCDEAKGREQSARRLAARSDMTEEAAREILSDLPEAQASAPDLLSHAMDQTGGGAGVPAGGEGSDMPPVVAKIDTQKIYDRRNKQARV